MKRVVLIGVLVMASIVACKKEIVTPDPIPGKVIVKQSQGTYSGYLSSELTIRRWSGNIPDSSIHTEVAIYETPATSAVSITSTINSVNFNSFPVPLSGNFYYASFYSEDLVSPFLAEYRSLNYDINSSTLGIININDNRPLPTYSNHNSIPLNFSKAAGYTLTLNNVSNCSFIEARINLNQAYRTMSPLYPTCKFYESELLNSMIGDQTNLDIILHQSKDTVINGRKFYIDKKISQSYVLTLTN